MLAILKFLNAHNLPIFQPILMILVSKFIVHRAISDKTYLSLGLQLTAMPHERGVHIVSNCMNGSFSSSGDQLIHHKCTL